jgi:hypothetical protein
MLEVLLKSKDFQTHWKARLGKDGLPTVEDFDSVNEGSIERCEALLLHLEGDIQAITEELSERPRQKDLFPKDRPALAQRERGLAEELTGGGK